MRRVDRYRMAAAEAETRRAALIDSAKAAKARVAPARIKADIKEKLVLGISNAGQSAADAVRKRPLTTAAVAVGVGAWFARRPLAALFRRLYVKIRHSGKDRRISETDNG